MRPLKHGVATILTFNISKDRKYLIGTILLRSLLISKRHYSSKGTKTLENTFYFEVTQIIKAAMLLRSFLIMKGRYTSKGTTILRTLTIYKGHKEEGRIFSQMHRAVRERKEK